MKKIVFILLICIVLFESIFLINQAKKLKEYKEYVVNTNKYVLGETVEDILYIQNRLDECKLDSSLDYKDLERIQTIYKKFDKNKENIAGLYNAGRISDKESYCERIKIIGKVDYIIEPIMNRIKSGREPFLIEPPEELIKINMLFINVLIENKIVCYNKAISMYDIDPKFTDTIINEKNISFVFDIFKEFINKVNDMYDYNK